jgi:hypothetical protein
MARFRPRISLISALLLTAIAGMAIVITQLWREVGPLRKEVRMLRDETGRLSIEDESKLHAIEVRTDDDLTWKWRVWVPQGQLVTVHSRWGNMPRKGVPVQHNSITLSPGEQWVTLTARRDRDDQHWEERLESRGGSVGGIIQPQEHWFDWPGHSSTGDGVSATTYVPQDNDKVVVLRRFRVGQNKSSDELNKSDRTAGFIVWLQRQ